MKTDRLIFGIQIDGENRKTLMLPKGSELVPLMVGTRETIAAARSRYTGGWVLVLI